MDDDIALGLTDRRRHHQHRLAVWPTLQLEQPTDRLTVGRIHRQTIGALGRMDHHSPSPKHGHGLGQFPFRNPILVYLQNAHRKKGIETT